MTLLLVLPPIDLLAHAVAICEVVAAGAFLLPSREWSVAVTAPPTPLQWWERDRSAHVRKLHGTLFSIKGWLVANSYLEPHAEWGNIGKWDGDVC